jgi:signal transduction histidine kinase
MKQLTIINIVLLLTFLLNVGLGLLVYLKDSPHRRVNISFSVLSWTLAGWVFSVAMFFIFKEQAWRLFWARMSFATASNIPSTFLYFSLVFPKENRYVSFSKLILIFFPSLVFTILSFAGLIVVSVHWETLTVKYGFVHKLFSIYVLLIMFAAIFFLVKSFKNSIGLERIQIKYCFLGTFLSTVPGVVFNLVIPAMGTSKLSQLGPSSTLILVSFITYSILKHRLMDINIVVTKGMTYVFLILLLFVPSFALILGSQKIFFQETNYLFSVVIFLILFLVTIFFQKIKPSTERAVEQLLFKDRYDYRETLSKFSKAMVTILDLKSLSKKIIETITQTMGVEKASLFFLNEERGGYYLLESKNIRIASFPPILPKGEPLPEYLQKMKEIIIREELIKGEKIQELNAVTQTMSQLESEVSIPLISKGQLVGMINLSHKFNRDIYSHEDLELLSTLANQTAIAIENARLYEDLKKSKSYIRRADRLASLGTLTAGLAHEIRNPLVAIKTFTQLLPERLEDEEFRNHFLNIASGEVDRISALVTELLEFARPSEPKFELEDINGILDGMILLVSTETKSKHIDIIKEYASDLLPITIDREQMKQVFLNILLNAIEATSENGKIYVKTRSFPKPEGEPYIQIEFTDTGCGIPTEYLEDIFTPFFTTKEKGSGLGLSISNQIIQDHKGYIDVESQVNKGTSFFVNLPLNQEHPRRRQSDFESPRTIFDSFERR